MGNRGSVLDEASIDLIVKDTPVPPDPWGRKQLHYDWHAHFPHGYSPERIIAMYLTATHLLNPNTPQHEKEATRSILRGQTSAQETQELGKTHDEHMDGFMFGSLEVAAVYHFFAKTPVHVLADLQKAS